MKDFKNVLLFILIGVILLLLLLQQCGKGSSNTIITSDTVFITDTVFDTITIETSSKPKVITVIDTVKIPIDVDTAAILADYYKQYIYKDSIREDSNYAIKIIDTVTQNKIIGRKYFVTNLRPTVINNTTINNDTYIYPSKHVLGIGGGVRGSANTMALDIGLNYTINNKLDINGTFGTDKSTSIRCFYRFYSTGVSNNTKLVKVE